MPPYAGPEFDIVRTEPGGDTLVAGKALPGSTVTVYVGGDAAGSALVGASGSFVIFLTLPETEIPLPISLLENTANGDEFASREVVLAIGGKRDASPKLVIADGEKAVVLQDHEAGEAPSSDADMTVADAGDMTSAAPGERDGQEDQQPADAGEKEREESGRDASESPLTDEGAAAPASGRKLGTATEVAQVPGIDPDATGATSASSDDVAASDDAADSSEVALSAQEDGEAPVTASATAQEDSTGELAMHAPDAGQAKDSPRESQEQLVAEAPAVRTEAPAAIDAPRLSLDTVSYDLDGDVVVVGRGSTDSIVNLYVDDVLADTGNIETDGNWSLVLDGIESGVHTLRIEEIDQLGNVTARVESPFRREFLSDHVLLELNAPQRLPETRVTQITIQPGHTLWAIARDSYGSGFMYVQIYEANLGKIVDPDLIYPGQVFEIPNPE